MIGITENRLKHIIGVARKCYKIGKDRNFNESICRKLFLMGYLHDVGYEFSEMPMDHPLIAFEMMDSLLDEEILYAIKNHGDPNAFMTLYLEILNIADLSINSLGEEVEVVDRLLDIKSRFKEDDIMFINPRDLAIKLNLI